jgi:predicted ABC-type ATPase
MKEIFILGGPNGAGNMHDLYIPLADNVRIYDNTERQQRLVAEKDRSGQLVITDKMTWSKICQVTQ